MAKSINTKKVPNLRFPGFEEEWEETTFGEIATNKSLKFNPEKSIVSVKCIELEHISGNNGELLGFIDGSQSGSIKNVFCEGDILFGKLRPYLRKYLQAPFDGVCSSEIWVLRGKIVTNSFLYQIVQTDKFIDLANQSSGSKMPRADWNVMIDGVFSFPSLGEQQKISKFLITLDERIRTQNKIIEELQTLIKILAKEIFDRKIRFKNSGENVYPEWDKTKMGDVFEFKVTNSYSREKLNYSEGIIKNIHYGDIHTKYRTLFNIEKEHTPYINLEVNTSSINKENYCQVGDLILADASEDLKDVGKSIEIVNLKDQKTLSGLHTILARPLRNIFAIGFCGYLFRSEKLREQIQKEAHGSKVLSIAPVRLSKLTLPIPSLIEQTLIVDILSSIEEKIEIERVILRKYNSQKKYLLQNLFI